MLPISAVCLIASILMLLHSVNGSHLVGCGVGSGCDSVMSSLWAYFAGKIPVSAFAVVTYLVMLVCLLFLSNGSKNEEESLDNIIWYIMLFISGSILVSGIWFSYLQVAELHQFCKYCTFTHLLGLVGVCIIYTFAPKALNKKLIPLVCGVIIGVVFAFLQVQTNPSIIYDNGVVSAQLPTFDDDELPVVGQRDAEHEILLMFDFQCTHCRALHKLLPEVIQKSDGDISFKLCPVSLSSECNPYIPHDGIDRFDGSCTMARLALAVWYNYPEKYNEVESYLLGNGDDRRIYTKEEAKEYVENLLGNAELDEALRDSRIKTCLSKSIELFGRTYSAEKNGIPRLIYNQGWLVPETNSAEELLSVINTSLVNN